jgi:hypothetical protein
MRYASDNDENGGVLFLVPDSRLLLRTVVWMRFLAVDASNSWPAVHFPALIDVSIDAFSAFVPLS